MNLKTNKPMQVGISAFLIILIFVAGVYVQYLLQGQGDEGKKSFFSFVGQAGKQWWEEPSPQSNKRFTAEKRDISIKEEIDEQVNLEKKLTIAQALNTCYEQICGDTDGSDIFTQGRVYLRTPVSSIKGTSPDFTGQQIGDAYYECVPYVDFCKDVSSDVKGDDAVVEFTCGEKIGKKAVEVDGEIFYKDEPYFTAITTLNECACGCSQGKCLACPPPPPVPPPVPVKVIDLVAKTIFLKSEQCINNFAFQLCNEGDKDVTEKFLVTVSSNGVTREYEVKENKLKELTAGKCSVISVPGLFHIGSFGLSLNQEATVEVQIDVGNQIAESKEDNNQVLGVINTGDAYYIFNQKTGKMDKCDVFCYESDLGKDYFNAGLITYKYSGDVKTKGDFCPTWDLNGLELEEQFCSLPIYQKTNGKLSNPYHRDNFNCLDANPPRKCDEGACVLLSVTCEDAYGKEGPCLQCLDYEGFSEETLALWWASPAYWVELDTDPFVVGEIDYTSIDNEQKLVKDLCGEGDDETLVDFYCSTHGEYPIIEKNIISCYRLKNMTHENKTGHFCEQGKCVETEIDLENCEGPKEDEIDLFTQKTTTETKLLGEQMSGIDFCLNDGDDVRKFYCKHQPENDIPANSDKDIPAKEKYYLSDKDFSCDQLLDENGMGGSCVQGKCVFFDESKKSCKEWGDIGLDPEDQGGLDVVTGYGLKTIESEYCVNDDILVETYCSGKDPIIFDHSCKDEGKVCIKGACKTADPANQLCTDQEGEVNKNKAGQVKGTDIYGDEFWGMDSCTNKEGNQELKESDYVDELSCNGNFLKSAVLKCDAGTLCNKGECKPVDESQVSCLPDPQKINTLITTNKFGEQNGHSASCPKGDGKNLMEVPACDEKNPGKVSWSELNCPEGTACIYKEEGASCDPFDPDGLKCVETEEGVTYGDGFGNEFTSNNWCAGKTALMTFSCLQEEKECPPGVPCPTSGNPYTLEKIECPQGQQCNWNSNKCETPDPDKSGCKILADGSVEYSDGFGNGQIYDSEECIWKEEGMGVSNYFCVDEKTLGEDFELCAKGTECHWEKKQCLSVDYSKVSCEGPSLEEIDLSKKEKVIAYDQFGEQTFFGDEKFNEDFCVNDFEPWEPDNIVAKFYCEDDEMEADGFTCPEGTSCNDGVCG